MLNSAVTITTLLDVFVTTCLFSSIKKSQKTINLDNEKFRNFLN